MLPLARNGLSAEQVKKILHDGSRNIRFEYALLDRFDTYKKTLDTVVDCRVDYSSLSSLKASANIKIKEETKNFRNRNLLRNSGAEISTQGNIPDGWTYGEWGGSGYAFTRRINDLQWTISGTASFEISGFNESAGSSGSYYQDVELEPNKAYTISCLLSAHRCTASLEIFIFDAAGNAIQSFLAGNVTDNYIPQKIKFTFTTPTNIAKLRVEIRKGVTISGTIASYLFADDIKLEEGDTATEWTPAPEDIGSEIDYLRDRIQPFCIFEKGNKEIKFPLGIFLLNSPRRSDTDNAVYREIECYSKLQILAQDKFENRYYIPAGTNYIAAISQIIASSGETKINLEPYAATTPNDKEFDIEMSKLEIINELLKQINYTSLNVDREGYFVAEPYILPVDREVEYEYLDNDISVISQGASEELDLFNVPNVFVRYVNNPERPPLRSVYENKNPDSITSTVSRGRRIVDIQSIEDTASQDVLDDLTIREAYNASQVYGHIEFETAIMPMHDYLDCLYLRYQPLGIQDKYVETSWSIDCKAGSMMKHRARKVVNI